MPQTNKIAHQFENWSIYVLLSSRGSLPGFHWGIFVPTDTPRGMFWHAINRTGGWHLEIIDTKTIPYSLSLCLAAKIGKIDSSACETLKKALEPVPGDGQPSQRNQEEFSCRVYVQDAIHALQTANVISLTKSIEEMVVVLDRNAEKSRLAVECCTGCALVDNDMEL